LIAFLAFLSKNGAIWRCVFYIQRSEFHYSIYSTAEEEISILLEEWISMFIEEWFNMEICELFACTQENLQAHNFSL
jgi:hypothetical protein